MDSLNKINHKRKLKYIETQNCNKKLKSQLSKDDMVKYVIKCTKNNTKLLEDLKYSYKSNEISDFSKRLKKYISKREKIEKNYNNFFFEKEEKKDGSRKQYEQSLNNKINKLNNNNNSNNNNNINSNNNKNYNDTHDINTDNTDNFNKKEKNISFIEKDNNENSINFVYTDNKKNLEEILIIKPINEVSEIKYSYCKLDTTNRYIIKRIKKENFIEAYNNDPDFKEFLITNHHLFETINDNKDISDIEVTENDEVINLYNEKEIFKERNGYFKNKYNQCMANRKINDKFKNSHIRSENESNGNINK